MAGRKFQIYYDTEAGGAAPVDSSPRPDAAPDAAPETPAEPDTSPSALDSSPTDGQESPTDGQESPTDGQESPKEGEDVTPSALDPQAETPADGDDSIESNDTEAEQSAEVMDYAAIELPEGISVDADELAHFAPVLQELKVGEEGYLKLVNSLAAWRQAGFERGNAIIEEGRANDYKALRADGELGGTDEHFEAQMQQAGRVLQLPEGQEVMSLFRANGIDNNLALVKLFHRIGGMIREDRLVNGKGGAEKEVNKLDAMFPKTANT